MLLLDSPSSVWTTKCGNKANTLDREGVDLSNLEQPVTFRIFRLSIVTIHSGSLVPCAVFEVQCMQLAKAANTFRHTDNTAITGQVEMF
jgi:hypothetical protein